MKYVYAKDLKPGDRIIDLDSNKDREVIAEVIVGMTLAAVRIEGETRMRQYSSTLEMLIEDREPTPKPNRHTDWHITYTRCSGLVAADLSRGACPQVPGPWCDTEEEARAGLLALWGNEVVRKRHR